MRLRKELKTQQCLDLAKAETDDKILESGHILLVVKMPCGWPIGFSAYVSYICVYQMLI